MIEYIDGTVALIKEVKSQDDFTLDAYKALEKALTFEEIMEGIEHGKI